MKTIPVDTAEKRDVAAAPQNDGVGSEGEAVANAEVEVVGESAEDIGAQSQGGPDGESAAPHPVAD